MKVDDTLETQLRAKSGSGFDVAFIAPQTVGHSLVLGVIEQASSSAQDQEVKTFLTQVRTKISAHRDHAARLQDSLRMQPNQTGQGGGPQQGGQQQGGQQQGGQQDWGNESEGQGGGTQQNETE
jgi:hypothetical protein